MNQPNQNNSAPSESSDKAKLVQIEVLISNLLRTGVIASLSIVLIGTLLSFTHHPDYVSSSAELSRITGKSAAFPHDLNDVAAGIANVKGGAIVMAGLLLLIATPVMRVAVSIFVFVHQKDRPFVVFSTIVLILLCLSFVIGKVER